jgi:Flp/Fap pilin component.
MRSRLLGFLDEESAQGMTEYSLIIALVALVVITSLALFGNSLFNNYLESVNRITP